MDLFRTINSIYTKNKIDIDNTVSDSIFLSKWLSYDICNISIIKKLQEYVFNIEPLHFFYLLFFHIPKKTKAPFLKHIKDYNKEPDVLYLKIKEILHWTDKEFLIHENILKKVIHKSIWYNNLGIQQK